MGCEDLTQQMADKFQAQQEAAEVGSHFAVFVSLFVFRILFLCERESVCVCKCV